jgi:1-acyl-sn-glycerol-3-phosphate acyltransferase
MNLPKSQNPKPTPWLIQCGVWLKILLHVISGVLILCVIFPFSSDHHKEHHIQNWSKKLLRIFQIEHIVVGGQTLSATPYLQVSNHISWLDIHVINAFRPIRFIAKSEVAAWPIFGWMAKQLGTVFIRRDSSRHARQVVGQVANLLKTESICLFPEGTSSIGDHVLPFKSNLFESAALAKVPIYPVAIEYISRVTGERDYSPAFVGDMGLLESMSAVIKNRHLRAQLTVLEPIYPVSGLDRKELALYCQEAISQTL